ncbi:ABC transporter ATP-binding protein [Saccharothrix violaceirubra]|uniref:ABC-2 type transport system ATP-binding protein n=1 Tax=Saccharothrix violaceirubra TaxID=413306 RepID=A0A7W7T1J6_9PSEU|nr:ABC transporter ATP-binding protein [Saccharothrix violaceirubra]MBB4964836.1 ABC-2 type transport system ATP-binding protein [Saccharothrix violaceirubra]
MKSGDRVVDVRGLRMRYGSRDVLDGVDLAVDAGEVVALLGPNGAGKTTTIEILEGFRTRSAGEVRVLGVDPDHGDETWRAALGVVLQSWRDHGRWRVRQLLDYQRSFYPPYRDRLPGTDEVLGLVGLTGQADARIATLSGGQRRRLDVAVGLVGLPDLLFLDEPTAGFDPAARQEFHDLVTRLSGVDGMAVLLTTHDLAEAERLADRILVLAGGRITAEGTAAGLAAEASAQTEVRYLLDGTSHVVSVADATEYVHRLFLDHGLAVRDLEVRRPRLEDVYLDLVRRWEGGAAARGESEVGV